MLGLGRGVAPPQIQTIEWEKQQLDVFAALQKGKDTLEDIHKVEGEGHHSQQTGRRAGLRPWG